MRVNKEQESERILDAVIWCKYQNNGGFVQLTQAAAKAGISSRTLSRYFPDKDKLLSAAAARYLQAKYCEYAEGFRGAESEKASGLDTLLRFIRYLFGRFRENELDARMITDAIFYYARAEGSDAFPQIQFDCAVKDKFTAYMKKGIGDGSIRRGADPEEAVLLLASTFIGLVLKLSCVALADTPEPKKQLALRVFERYMEQMELCLKS